MLFNSVEFLLLFLPLTVWLFSKAKQRSQVHAMGLLLAASLIFYSWWDVRFAPLLLSSILVNYPFGRWLDKHRSRGWLVAGIVLNLMPLVAFKYSGWLAELAGHPLQFTLVLPLGLSFFTFLQVAYLVSIYKGENQDSGLLAYATFVTYFPHLIAGPILRHNEVTAQLITLDRRRIDLGERFGRGLLLLVVGLFKKVVVADMLCAGLADSAFASAASADFSTAWTGALAYTCQLYFDFSGYCEMALGASLLMGISIPKNFDSPYRATNIADFWRRWHITLGAFFRDHVYIPLGGDRRGWPRLLVAITVTMLLTGLWHGASWTFVIWGGMHAAYLITYRAWSAAGGHLPVWAARLCTLACVVFGWVIFRAANVGDALAMWKAMLGMDGFAMPPGIFQALGDLVPPGMTASSSAAVWGPEPLLLAALLWWCATARNVHEVELYPQGIQQLAHISALAAVSFFTLGQPSNFLYWSW